mgnify:CR=1 FL=1
MVYFLDYFEIKLSEIFYSILLIWNSFFIALTLSLKKSRNSKPATTLADLSGLAWTGGDSFAAVHDAKVEDELFKPRVANLQLPASLRGITFTDQRTPFRGRTPNDLESIARIPGSNNILLVESGDSKSDPAIQRIFKASVQKNRVRITSQTTWPVNILNVEGTAVAKLDDRFFFVFAVILLTAPVIIKLNE